MRVPILEVEHLTKEFAIRGRLGTDHLLAVDDVSFSIERGGSLAIVGESGSGKTTTARIVAGLETSTSGSVRVEGSALAAGRSGRVRRARAQLVQMVFQDPFASLDPRQTLGDCLGEVLTVHRKGADRRARRTRSIELLDRVGLDERHLRSLPRALSGGQRQRFAIARALAVEPQLLILDEAVSALDVSVQAQVLNLLVDLRAELGLTYLFVSHDLAVVRQVCDTTMVMNRGRVVEMAPTAQVFDSPREEYTRQLLSAIPRPGWKPSRRASALIEPA